ncbi:SGNH/GDSL hydrolase family protein [Lachnoclostridium phytofermentans]|uniref:SGNH hydrolase-type esterase domain-containing protein n=1 Tax=Lachnoclostridium phytofermentans (strain ATCC 700394 / DSM 18823 / ISDg) TaxID=357809 RepID=A9KIQ8_LACP7|nr:SGNH/GDSL hydrolase family protein [Lachnoclostridium phytofermentans]ABX43921.1 conserved hypothetical protein [Lachnoclostridium phytofermentans ISDg]
MKTDKPVDKNMIGNETKVEENITWLTVEDCRLRLSGFAFYEEDHRLERVPSRLKSVFKEINPCLNELGVHTAGGQLSFRSNTSRVFIKAKITTAPNMVNMTPVAQCGFDCYIGDNPKDLKFFGITKFDTSASEYTCEVVSKLDTTKAKEFLIHFPLYAGVMEVEIGIDSNAVVEPPTPYEKEGKLIFYGTSITQGGCASRPGMAYTNYLARKLNLAHCNFGFSGNGLGEYEVAKMLSEIEQPLLYIIDYEANSGTNGRMVKSLDDFVHCLRESHKEVPILVVSRVPHMMDFLEESTTSLRNSLREFQRETVEKFRTLGDNAIYFLDGYTLWGDDFDEYTVDFIHPTDLGFYFMGKGLEPIIREILNKH